MSEEIMVEDDATPRTVTMTVLDESGAQDWKLAEFETMLARAIADIPVEFHVKAFVDLDGGYDGESPRLKIYYTRPETAADRAKRAAEIEEMRHRREAYERIEFERLKKKFGDAT